MGVEQVWKGTQRHRFKVLSFDQMATSHSVFVYAYVAAGVSISLARMSSVVEVRVGDMDVTVQPGIKWEELNTLLKPHGLFFPMDPGPGASIGGMVCPFLFPSPYSPCLCAHYRSFVFMLAGGNELLRHQCSSLRHNESQCLERQGKMMANVQVTCVIAFDCSLVAQAVLADGTIVSTGRRARKSVAGYVCFARFCSNGLGVVPVSPCAQV